ncbi:MAG TPA: Xaa-Pro peptidase family protein [Thermomicrobiales bacterium]|nr:Xaa-Pro peptidase family protein [Thermomicrobiales bacterium]
MDYAGRLERVRAAMAERGIGLLYLPFSADAAYLTGLEHETPGPTATNRPGDFAAGVYLGPARGPVAVGPRMGGEGLRADAAGKDWLADVLVMGEPADYEATLRDVARDLYAGGAVAVPDRAWAATALALRRALPDAPVVSATEILAPLRAVKDADELAVMRRAAALTDDVYATILPRLAPGVTEREVAAEIERLFLARGGAGVSFHTAILFLGGGSARAGYSGPTAQRLERGMGVAFDFGVVLDGYCSDFGRTVFVGEPDAECRRVYDLVIGAQGAAIAAMRDGALTCADADHIARGMIADAGYGAGFTHRLGHSIGRDVHEWPSLMAGEETTLRAGMTFTVEPSVLLPGKAFVRIEDVVLVTPAGGEALMRAPRELLVVGA